MGGLITAPFIYGWLFMRNLFSHEKKSLADKLWGWQANPWLLIFAALFIILFMLGAKEIWTQEWRWANICHGMMIRHDYFHPYLAGVDYYDKPLLSYWLMIAFSYITRELNIWAIRLPSAIAGLITLWSTYVVGKKLSTKQTGMIACWLLISTFYFVFWSRVGSADMLNVAGIMAALAWYFTHREKPTLLSFTIFFIIIAVSCLLKGIVAAAVVFLVLIPEIFNVRNLKKYLNWRLIIATLIGLGVYLIPFILSHHFNTTQYHESGLYEVFKENFVRYVQPFDNKGPIYTYFKFLPLYTFPWILFLLGALVTLLKRWTRMPAGSRWFFWALLITFIFFTGSGSRRSYYVLPMVPFAILFTADWIRIGAEKHLLRNNLASYFVVTFYAIIFLVYGIVYPVAYTGGGLEYFAKEVKSYATKIQPWQNWNITMIDAKSKSSFYLNSPKLINFLDAKHDLKYHPTRKGLLTTFPILLHPNKNDIIIVRTNYMPVLKPILDSYHVIYTKPTYGDRLMKKVDPSLPVALLPK